MESPVSPVLVAIESGNEERRRSDNLMSCPSQGNSVFMVSAFFPNRRLSLKPVLLSQSLSSPISQRLICSAGIVLMLFSPLVVYSEDLFKEQCQCALENRIKMKPLVLIDIMICGLFKNCSYRTIGSSIYGYFCDSISSRTNVHKKRIKTR